MSITRLIFILFLGTYLSAVTIKSRTHLNLGDILLSFLIIVIAIPFLGWTIYQDTKLYRREKYFLNLAPSILASFFIVLITFLNILYNIPYNKATLLEAQYDTEYDLMLIDFKIDGTYIFSERSFMSECYYYGTYKIDSNRISMDENARVRNYLSRYLNITQQKNSLLLVQADSMGQIDSLDTYAPQYKITQDNRNGNRF